MAEALPVPDREALFDALHDVIDPELGFNIVDLGLVYDIAVADRQVTVTMTMTTPGCPAQDYITQGVEQRLLQEEALTGIFVDVVWEPRWSPEKMSPVAKAHFRISG
ncbi:MAG: metal-sulfur cluster assembly factor [Acetobacteraceae bacterium]